MGDILTLYLSDTCPAGQRVVIALEEAGAEYTRYEIDLVNKPGWYARVNPSTGQVPAITYGPKSDPTDPHPDAAKLTESLVLLEFVADLYPASGLLSTNPVERAHTRFIIDVFKNKVYGAFYAVTLGGTSPDELYDGLEALQAQLEPRLAGQFLGGDKINIADAAMAPFFARMDAHFGKDVGEWEKGGGLKIHAEIFGSERFRTLQRYVAALLARESVRKSFPEDKYLEEVKEFMETMKKA